MIKILPEDKIFSDYIRTRDNWTCRRCGKRYEPPTKALHNMHCFSRGGFSVRFYEDDCMAGCYGCHSYLDRHPDEKKKFWKKEIGIKRFNTLERLSKKPLTDMTKQEKRQWAKDYYKQKLSDLIQ